MNDPVMTDDKSQQCCGNTDNCSRKADYCFHRNPRYAVYEEVQSNGAGTMKVQE